MQAQLTVIVPGIMERLKDRTNFPVKLGAERALVHCLQIHGDPETLNKYSQTLDPNTARVLVDYAKRVLSKLNPDSEPEED
jgi:hypothetical protein